MKIRACVAALVAGTTLCHAQDLVNRIPKKADVVATFRTGNFFSLLSVNEFNNSVLGQAALGRSGSSAQPQNVSDLGIDIRSNGYYFLTNTDSISYHCFWLPLADAAKFERLVNSDQRPVNRGSINRLVGTDSSTVVMWNDKRALVMSPSLRDDFFNLHKNAERYGLKVLNKPNEDIVIETDPQAADMDSTEIDTVAAPPAEQQQEAEEIVRKADSLHQEYTQSFARQEQLKKVLALNWTTNASAAFFDFNGPAITTDAAYANRFDQSAVAGIWVRDFNQILSPMVSAIGFSNPFFRQRKSSGFKNLTGQLYFDKEKMRLVTDMELSSDLASEYQKIYSGKLNKKFLRYVDSRNVLGYFGFAVNTEAYLRSVPALIQRSMPLYFGSEEAQLAEVFADIFATIVDEKSIGKVIKGDGLFIVTDVSEREVKYKSFEYDDDDFNGAPVEKTKTETVPDFVFMFSSQDHKIFDRLLSLGERTGRLTRQGKLYKVERGFEGIDLHFLIHDQIVFIGNSPAQLENISNGSLRLKPTAMHRSLLTKNAMSAYFAPKTLSQKLAGTWPKDSTMAGVNEVLKDMGGVYLHSNGIRKNKITTEIVAEKGAGEENALQYLFRLISVAAR